MFMHIKYTVSVNVPKFLNEVAQTSSIHSSTFHNIKQIKRDHAPDGKQKKRTCVVMLFECCVFPNVSTNLKG